MQSIWRFHLEKLLWLGLCLSGLTAFADDIPVIKLEPAGPKQLLPLGSAFYLSGSEKLTVEHVRPVFVRVKDSLFDLAPDCGAVSEALSDPLLDGDGENTRLFTVSDNRSRVDKLWDEASSKRRPIYAKLKNKVVLLPPLATFDEPNKPNAGEHEYKVLVNDPAFFRPGSQFCFLLYKQVRETKAHTKIAAEVLKATESYSSCREKTDSTERAQCADQVISALMADVNTLLEKTSAAKKQEVRAQVFKAIDEKLWAVAQRVVTFPEVVGMTADLWKKSLVESRPRPALDSTLAPVEHLPQTVAAHLLARHGAAGIKPATGKKGLEFFTAQVIPIRYIGLATDLPFLKIASLQEPPPKGQLDKLDVKLSSLSFPGSPLTYEDILQFAEGRLRWGDTFIPVEDFAAKAAKISKKPDEVDAQTRQKLRKLEDWLNELLSLLQRASSSSGLHEMQKLREWMKVSLKCQDYQGMPDMSQGYACPADATAAPFFSFSGPDSTPFARMRDAITDYLSKLEEYSKEVRQVTLSVETVSIQTHPGMKLRAQISRDGFFTHYVTPVTGFSYVPAKGGGGWFHYVGIQWSTIPNPVDEPMWVNGPADDVHRLLALELGFGTPSTAFDSRRLLRGPDLTGGHPLHLGLAVRPLPYVSAALSLVVLSERTTPLPQERGNFLLVPAFSVSAQINVPDLVRKLIQAGQLSSMGVIP